MDLLTADESSLALVATLLAEEIQAQLDAKLAIRLQMSYTVDCNQDEGRGSPCSDFDMLKDSDEEESDELISLRQQLDMINSTLSKGAIVDLAGTDHDVGQDSDALSQRGLEATLGEGYVQNVMCTPSPSSRVPMDEDRLPMEKGKGKLRSIEEEGAIDPGPSGSNETLPTCSICFEPVRTSYDPYSASLKAGSSDNIIYGMYVGPREDSHIACIDCFGAYVGNKLEDGTGKAFPMRCVESRCPYELTDDDARHGLGEANLEAWHYRKLVDSQPTLFCPNRSCSARIVRDDEMDNNPQAECPSCHIMMCVDCQTPWHTSEPRTSFKSDKLDFEADFLLPSELGYTCDQYQALPSDERDPEDIALFDFAREKGYSRCPGCKMVLELLSGCYHLTCACGVESFAVYLDERHLLQPELRPRDGALNAVVPRQALPIPAAVPVEEVNGPPGHEFYQLRRNRRYFALNFLDRGQPLATDQFTTRMMRDLQCGYCYQAFDTSNALRNHLADLSHSVYQCCSALFETGDHLNYHTTTDFSLTGHHPNRWVIPGQRQF
ncbi:hypothetical protein JCM5353_007778 [Sporobolomyces roseus]